jgi:hypothetical protein
MHKAFLKISFFTCIVSACQPIGEKENIAQLKGPAIPTGIYIGMEEMEGFPAENPGDKWYHENYMYIRPDSLFLEGNPVVVHKNGEKGYSASDGGFYSYSGRIDTAGGKFTAKLLMFAHDYIAAPLIIKDTTAAKADLSGDELVKRGIAVRDSSFYKKTYTITPTATGFDMDGVHYVPTAPDSLLALPDFPNAERFFGQMRISHPTPYNK